MYLPVRVLLPAALLAFLLVAAVILLLIRSASPTPVQIFIPNAADAPIELKVDVSGSVQSPGVYQLGLNDRVEDAVRAAGGPTINADLSRINLAARLRDGDQVFVPTASQSIPANAAGAPRLNINTATQKDLEALPGIGAVRAKQVIDSRTSAGLFLDTIELVSRQILTLSVYEQVKGLVSVN